MVKPADEHGNIPSVQPCRFLKTGDAITMRRMMAGRGDKTYGTATSMATQSGYTSAGKNSNRSDLRFRANQYKILTTASFMGCACEQFRPS